jgi:hypothetical protein
LAYAIVSVLFKPHLKRKWKAYRARRKSRKSQKNSNTVEPFHAKPTYSPDGIYPTGNSPYNLYNNGEKDKSLTAVTSSYSFGQSANTPPEPEPEHWDIEDTFVLKANKVIASLGGDLLAIFLTVVVLQQTGRSAFASEKTTLWNMFLLYAVRPRVAPFTGVLGFFKGWSEDGFADLFSDFLLSCVAGICVGIHFVLFYWVPPLNPLAPVAQLKLLAVGALLAGGPTLLSLMISLLGSSNNVLNSQPTLFDILWGFAWRSIGLILFIASLPLVAIMEIFAMLYIATCGRRHKKSSDGKREKSRFEEPLTFNSPRFAYVYIILVVLSWMVNAGNWMFFSIYLKLEGDVYCPSNSLYVTLIWIFIPAAVKLPVTALGWYID